VTLRVSLIEWFTFIVVNIYFIAAHGENFRRLPEFLAGPGVRITLICCTRSLLRKSEFIDQVVAVTQHPNCNNFVRDLLAHTELIKGINGWVIFASDEDLYNVAHSDLDEELKLKLLPVRRSDHVSIVGSKAQFIKTCKESEVPIPKSDVVDAPEQVHEVVKNFSTPFVIKADRGAGGAGVRVVSSEADLVLQPVPASWYPIVIQEFVFGEPRGVDAFFREGELLAWLYSGDFDLPDALGPTMSRRYFEPPVLDFVEALKKYGRATGAHGFANGSLFYLPEEKRHVMFELDLRTNAWHHLGQKLGLDWVSMMSQPMENFQGVVQYPTNLPPGGLTLKHWQRQIEFAIQARDWRTAIQLIRIPKRKRYPIEYKDASLNRAQVRGLLRLAVLAIAQSIFALLPSSLSKGLKERGATARIATIIATR
jgi:hypothetical protein